MIMLFEDDPDSPMSRLLKSVLCDSVDFCKGNQNMRDMIRGYLTTESNIICCLDFVYDNPDTLAKYQQLREEFGRDIQLVRIPCIEIFAYMLLSKFGISRRFINANNSICEYCLGNMNEYPNVVYEQSSFEKYIKALTEITPLCLNTKGTDGKRGRFYFKSCSCGDTHCSTVSGDISVMQKFCTVYDYVPKRFVYNEDMLRLRPEVVESWFEWEEFYSRMAYCCTVRVSMEGR